MSVRRATLRDVDRVVEVIARTNQLNATRLRLNRAGVVDRIRSKNHVVEVVELRDTFGDFGIIGVLLAEQGSRAWTIEELAFSCRAMGRKVELKTLTLFAKWAQRSGARCVEIQYRPSGRNTGMRAILEEAGFEPGPGDRDADAIIFSVSDFGKLCEPSAPWLTVDVEEEWYEVGVQSRPQPGSKLALAE
jgi:FkbH-like protein